MDILLLIIEIIIILILIYLILQINKISKKENTEIKFPEIDTIKNQLENIQNENRSSQSQLRQETSSSLNSSMKFLSETVSENMTRTNDEQSKKLTAMSNSLRQQVDIMGKSQTDQLISMKKSMDQKLDDMDRNISNQLKQLEERFSSLEKNTEAKLEALRSSIDTQLTAIRNDNIQQSDNFRKTTENKLELLRGDNSQKLENIRATVDEKLQTNLESMSGSISTQMKQLENRFQSLESNTETKLQNIRSTIENQLQSIREDNNTQLEKIRGTVDEKLQDTLEKKMNESFKLVSERLEQVYTGLGEMQAVAQGVGDLKKVLSNVKIRGILGEVQLGAILKEILTPDQYEENVITIPKTKNRVEFAVKLPGAEDGKYIYLPIDSKFNGEKFAKLQDAYESGDKAASQAAKKDLIDAVKKCAKDISEKYIQPPDTTQFAIMFLPFEGLYAEIVNTAGLVEELQRTYKINIAGPSTMAAMLNSLKMGFQTLAIQKRSGQVWEILGAVKTEFETFEKALTTTQERLRQADESLEKLVGVRTRQMNKKLSKIESINTAEFKNLLN